MSTSAPPTPLEGELVQLMVEIKDTLRQLATAVQTIASSSAGGN